MATANAAVKYVPTPAKDRLSVVWTPLANGDNGSFIDLNEYADVCVQAFGTFGAGGSVQIEGSNDALDNPATAPTNWTLCGAAITAAGIVQLPAKPRYIRPNVTAGDGTTALTVQIYARRPRAL